MLKGYKILESIPAYDLKRINKNADFYGKGINETLEEYKRNTIFKNNKINTIKEINYMINHYELEENVLFVLNTILNDERLLNKTKFISDGSYRNMRIWACKNEYEDNYFTNIYDDDRTVGLEINWNNVIDKKIDFWGEGWNNFEKSIKKKDIIKVLNNIEEIFIQA